MGCADGEGMDPVFFTIKRAYYATLKLTRRALAAMGLTAARFDLLDAMYRLGARRVHLQSNLRRGLGVARSTISVMMRSLERLGLVTRRRDGRDILVALTPEGRGRVRRAFYGLVLVGHVGLALDGALAPGERRWPAQRACVRARRHLQVLCLRIRDGFGDAADLDRLGSLWWVRDQETARRARSHEARRQRQLGDTYPPVAPSA